MSPQHTHAEAAPSLLSSASAPSIPSASSSTVGSPYSSHAQLASNPFLYNSQFVTGPAIICDDSFPYGYDSAHFEHEATVGQDAKLNASFVGKCADLSSFAQRSTAMPVQEYLPSEPLVSSPKPIIAFPEATTTLSSKQNPSADDDAAAQVSSIASNSKSHSSRSDAIFKSPTTPASAYPKNSPPNAKRTIRASAEQPKDSFRFSYSFPSSSSSPMPQRGYKPQFNFFSQSHGSSIPPIEASCSSFLSFALPNDPCATCDRAEEERLLTSFPRPILDLWSTEPFHQCHLWHIPSTTTAATFLTSRLSGTLVT